MMTSLSKMGWVLSLAIGLSGCATSSFSDLQRTYAALVSEQGRYRGRDLTPEEMMHYEDVREGFYAVSVDAEPLIERQSEAQTRASVARLGALSAAYAGPKGLSRVGELAKIGLGQCEAIAANAYGAPRDCALLAFATAIAQQEAVWADLRPIRQADFDGSGQPGRQARDAIGADLDELAEIADASQSAWADLQSGKAIYKGLSPETTAALEAYRRSFACTAMAAATAMGLVARHDASALDIKVRTEAIARKYRQQGFSPEQCATAPAASAARQP